MLPFSMGEGRTCNSSFTFFFFFFLTSLLELSQGECVSVL